MDLLARRIRPARRARLRVVRERGDDLLRRVQDPAHRSVRRGHRPCHHRRGPGRTARTRPLRLAQLRRAWRVRRGSWRDLVPRHPRWSAALDRAVPRRTQDSRDRHAAFRPRLRESNRSRRLRHHVQLHAAGAGRTRCSMRYAVLVPEALVVALAVVVLLAGRFGWMPRTSRAYLPQVTALIVLVAFGIELWAGASVTTYFGGALIQDRFALFAKAAALLTAAIALAATDWAAEDSLHIGLAMPLLAAFGVMVAASAGDMVGLWAGLELAAAAAVVMVSLRRPDLALRLLGVGGALAPAAARLPGRGPARMGHRGTGDPLPLRDRGVAVPAGRLRDRGDLRPGAAGASRRGGAGDRWAGGGAPGARGGGWAGH